MTGPTSIAMLMLMLPTIPLTVARAAPADLDGLARNSPFSGPPAAAAGNSANSPLEFRGVLVDHGETFFSLFEVSTHQALWVGLKEPGNPYIVQNYDSSTAQVLVQYQGKTVTLPLRQAKIGALAATGVAPNQAPAAGTPSNVTTTAPGDDSRRMAAVAEEIRRRRALRQQAVQANPPVPPARQ